MEVTKVINATRDFKIGEIETHALRGVDVEHVAQDRLPGDLEQRLARSPPGGRQGKRGRRLPRPLLGRLNGPTSASHR